MGVESDRNCHDLPSPSLGWFVGSMSNRTRGHGKAYPRGRPEASYRRTQPTSPRFAQSLEQDTIPESYKSPPYISWLPRPVQPAGSAKSKRFPHPRRCFWSDTPRTPQLRTPRAATAGLGQRPSLEADPSARVCLSCRRFVEAPSGQEDPTDMDTKVGKNAHQTRHPRGIMDAHGIA